MQRQTNTEALILTFNHSTDITECYINSCIRHLTEALRQKAKRSDWSYILYVKTFFRDSISHKIVRPYVSVFLYANPCTTVRQWLSAYWNGGQGKQKGKRLGIVKNYPVKDGAGYILSLDSPKCYQNIGTVKLFCEDIPLYDKPKQYERHMIKDCDRYKVWLQHKLDTVESNRLISRGIGGAK